MPTEPRPAKTSFDDYSRVVPSDEESAFRAVEPFRDLTPAARFAALERLLREMDALLGDRPPWRGNVGEPFWKHWMDPTLGRPSGPA